MTVALIDGDIIAYKAAFVSTDTFEDQEIFDPLSVQTNVGLMVRDWSQLAKGKPVICLSSEDHRYFRHTIYPEYKGNRATSEKPKALGCAYDCLKEDFDFVQYEGLEADDVMGILAGSTELSDPVIVSIDKDMLTVPGKVLNPNKMRRPIRVTKPAADRLMLKQALTGDSTDGYPGVPGIGPVKADKILSEHADIRSAWRAVVEAFGSEEDALTMARLARILRADDYNIEKGEVRLWHPSNKDTWIKAKTELLPTQKTGDEKASSKTRARRSAKTGTKATASRKKTTRVSPVSGP